MKSCKQIKANKPFTHYTTFFITEVELKSANIMIFNFWKRYLSK